MPAMAPNAMIRPVPDSFDQALVGAGRPTLDVSGARAQHDRYRAQLETSGYQVDVVPSDEAHPDCVFIEDTAVVLGRVAVVTLPGAVERRGETAAVAEAMSRYLELEWIAAPGTLDGGDVMIMDRTLYVGRSKRTNDHGIDQLRQIAVAQGLDVIPVAVHGALHLKSAVLPVDAETVVVTPNAVDEGPLDDLHIVYETDAERNRFSALPLADGRVLVTANAPGTSELVANLGIEIAPIDVAEIQAADGGLTCLSILF